MIPISHHQHGRNHQGRQGQTGDRVVGGADQTDQIAGHRREKNSEHEHDHREHKGRRGRRRRITVEEEHRDGHDADRDQHPLEVEVVLGALGVRGRRAGPRRRRRLTDAVDQRATQGVQGVEGGHDHGPHRERPDLFEPHIPARAGTRSRRRSTAARG